VGRIIGIDLGLKRTGIAVTDPNQMIATPLKVVRTGELFDFLKKYTSMEDVERFVVGYPLKPDGSPTHTTEAADVLGKKLRNIFPEKEVVMVDERYTTSLAMDAMISGGTSRKYRREKGNIDKISATIILQSYLEQKSHGDK
jgi:putative Holliday junction resolvase